jgi:hypothetical protein
MLHAYVQRFDVTVTVHFFAFSPTKQAQQMPTWREKRWGGSRTKATFSGGRPGACGARHMRAQPRNTPSIGRPNHPMRLRGWSGRAPTVSIVLSHPGERGDASTPLPVGSQSTSTTTRRPQLETCMHGFMAMLSVNLLYSLQYLGQALVWCVDGPSGIFTSSTIFRSTWCDIWLVIAVRRNCAAHVLYEITSLEKSEWRIVVK